MTTGKKKPSSKAMGRATMGAYRVAQQKAKRTQNELAEYVSKEGKDVATKARMLGTKTGSQLKYAREAARVEKADKAKAVTKNRKAAQDREKK